MVKAVVPYGVLLALVAGSGCGGSPGAGAREADSVPAASVASRGTPGATDTRPVVLFLGTSLTAGFGLDPSQAYPALIQTKIDSVGFEFQVVNGGVSGETSAGARRRIGWLLRKPAAVLVIETGANDGLRGTDPDELERNLTAIIQLAREQQPPPAIVLVGMEAPPNLGREYTRRFRAVYRDLAAEYGLRLMPFLLSGVAGIDSLNQADGIHPTPAGQRIVADNMWRVLEPVLRRVGAGAGAGTGSGGEGGGGG